MNKQKKNDRELKIISKRIISIDKQRFVLIIGSIQSFNTKCISVVVSLYGHCCCCCFCLIRPIHFDCSRHLHFAFLKPSSTRSTVRGSHGSFATFCLCSHRSALFLLGLPTKLFVEFILIILLFRRKTINQNISSNFNYCENTSIRELKKECSCDKTWDCEW